jgi:hypothetical protein
VADFARTYYFTNAFGACKQGVRTGCDTMLGGAIRLVLLSHLVSPLSHLVSPSVTLGQPFVTLGQPFVTLGQPFVTLGQPFGTLGQPFCGTWSGLCHTGSALFQVEKPQRRPLNAPGCLHGGLHLVCGPAAELEEGELLLEQRGEFCHRQDEGWEQGQ